ncbi:MAG: S8 family serine peptidase, partial [candidate division Zixibacteria bacterium]|nr:S8 family serine peptidase [candidate division Zixibacteria bacterium]
MNIVFRFFLVIIFCWVSSSASFQSLTDKIRIRPDLPADQVIKVWVFFTDKGGGDVSLAKCVPVTDKALWRRAMRGADVDNTFYDREVNPVYVSATEPLVEKIGYPSRWLNAVSVEVKTAKLSKLADLPFVRRITEVAKFIRKPVVADDNLGFRKPAVTTDHDYGDSYNQLNQIRVIDLHHQGLSGAGVTILMLDSGYKVSHQAFSHLDIDSTYDFINNDPDVEDSSGYIDQQYHGTMTLSVIGGLTEGEVIGVAYDATYLLAKTEISHDNIEIEIEEDYWVAGIEWGEHLGADVVSSSLGYSDWYTYEDMDGKSAVTTVAADIAASLGVIVVNSMGNGGRTAAKPTLIAPADGDSVIA